MPRYNNDGRSAKFLVDTRQGFQLDRMKGSRKKDMKIKLDTDVNMGDDDDNGSSSHGRHNRDSHRGGKKFGRRNQHQGSGGGAGGGGGGGGGGRKGGRNKWTKQGGHEKGGSGGGHRHEYGPGWHKCTIFGGSSMSRDNILQTLATALRNKNLSVMFQPIAYMVNPPNSVFYIETRSLAEAIGSLSFESIKFRIIHIGSPPTAPITRELEERLSVELKGRLNQMGHLNLSNFHNTISMSLEYYLPLYRTSVGSLVGRLIKDWIGLVNSVDVSCNKLSNSDSLAFLNQGTNIKSIVANDNKLRDLSALDRLKIDSLLELNLLNNPLSEKHTDRTKYELDVRKKFPGLLKLDNRDIDPSNLINFDIEKYTVPSVKGSWFCNESAQNVVKTFVSEYVRLYDSKREDLANAYSEQAVLTLSSSYMKDNSSISSSISHHGGGGAHRLSAYIGESRNILTRGKQSRKSRLVHVGRQEIIKFLTKLPASKHVDYVIDMPVALEAFIVFTMQGIFQEPLEKNAARHFTRSFTLVPFNNGFVIVNEMFFVTNPTPQQIKSLQTSKPTYIERTEPVQPRPLVDTFKPPETMEEKLKVFIDKSHMNHEWAKKCLEENGWDFDRSIFVFNELCKAGKIPPEAFQSSSSRVS